MKKVVEERYTFIWVKVLRACVFALILSAILFGIFLPPVIRYGLKQEALAALGDAKNVELTMRLLSLDYYGRSIPVFSPQYANGMTDEAEAEVRDMSMVDGNIILLEWSAERMRPLAFLYTEGSYTVRFVYDTETEENTWEVFRFKKVLEFGK